MPIDRLSVLRDLYLAHQLSKLQKKLINIYALISHEHMKINRKIIYLQLFSPTQTSVISVMIDFVSTVTEIPIICHLHIYYHVFEIILDTHSVSKL